MRAPVFLALTLTAFGGTAAHAATPDIKAAHGVWRGTIGDIPVQACFQHTDYEDFGAYYYMRHLTIITLGTLDGKTGPGLVMSEAANSDKAADGPLWHIASVQGGHLTGTWTEKGKSLPIALTAVPLKKDDDAGQPCGSDAFTLPRFTKPVVTIKPARVDGIAYSRILVDIGKQFPDSGFETFQLAGTTPAIRRINAELYKDVPTDAGHAGYFACVQGALAQNGMDGNLSTTITPETLTPGFMVESYSEDEYCGGAHPDSGTTYSTWDLSKGTRIDLDTMLTPAALTRTVHGKGTKNQYVETAYTAPFKAMILHDFPTPDPDCKEALDSADFWSMRLTKAGMAFTPLLPHVAMACTDDAVIPFAKLQPYLTPAGKTLVAAFAAEIKGRK
ncbi:hypothetical protein [Asticcacaulis solisilvae]|uniref:hypothetical protein n=1 Tax=Asticcacaulis solisilvae TaxID=1217274 RepID=UPI003FD70E7B